MRAAKAWVAAAGTIVMVLTAALADNVFSLDEIGQVVATVVVAIGTVFAVYQVPNTPAA